MIKTLDETDLIMVEAHLDKIRKEMERLLWNKHQKEMRTPFDNTGEEYINNVFAVRAYDWDGDEKEPNFQYKSLKINWYKYCGRGMYGVIDEADYRIDFFKTMLVDCITSLRKDFGEING